MEGLEVCQTPNPASEVSLPKVGRATDGFPASCGDAACWILGGLHLSATVVAHGSSPVLQDGHSVDGCRRLAFLPRPLSLGQYEWVGLLSDDS